MLLEIGFLAVLLVTISVMYKFLPYRELGQKKPVIEFMPKYKTKISSSKTTTEIDGVLAEYGFSKVIDGDDVCKYTRGSVLGDLSIKLTKIKVYVSFVSPSIKEVCVEAGWVAFFDTGDHWQFSTELSEKLVDA